MAETYITNDGSEVDQFSAEHAYDEYGRSVGFVNFRGDPMPRFADLPKPIRNAWRNVAGEMGQTPSYRNFTAESRGMRSELDGILQRIKTGDRQSRSRVIAAERIEDAIMRLGMDLKEQREEGYHDEPNPYPNSYDASSTAPISPTADGLTL